MGGENERHRRKKSDAKPVVAPGAKNNVYEPKIEPVVGAKFERPPIGKGKKLTPEVKELVKALETIDSSLDSLDEVDPRSKAGRDLLNTIKLSLDVVAVQIPTTADSQVKAELVAYHRELREDADAQLALQDTDKTGFGIVDEGTLCERDDAPEDASCFLTEKKRERLLTMSFQAGVTSAMANFHAAINNKQLELLTKKPEGLNGVLDFLFTSGTGALIGVAVKALAGVRALAVAGKLELGGEPLDAGLAKLVGKVTDKQLTSALTSVTGKIKKAVTSQLVGASDSEAGQASFLTLVANQIKPLHQNLINEAPVHLDDAGLVALAHVYSDTDAHSVTAYRARVDTLVEQYKSSHMAELGNTFAGDGRYELHGSTVVKKHGKGEIGSNGGHGDQRQPVYDDGRTEVVGQVPPELLALAESIQEARLAAEQAAKDDSADRDAKWKQMQDSARRSGPDRPYDRHH